jgi:hypothetical protein
MKRSILLSLACALLASSASSIYAVGLANITKISTIIDGIKDGSLKGSAIVDQIKTLKSLSATDRNANIITHPTEGLNTIAYRALQKNGYKLNSMQVVQDVLSGKLPTIESRSTLRKSVPIIDILSAQVDSRTSATATISSPQKKQEAIEKIEELKETTENPEILAALEKTQTQLAQTQANNTPVPLPTISVLTTTPTLTPTPAPTADKKMPSSDDNKNINSLIDEATQRLVDAHKIAEEENNKEKLENILNKYVNYIEKGEDYRNHYLISESKKESLKQAGKTYEEAFQVLDKKWQQSPAAPTTTVTPTAPASTAAITAIVTSATQPTATTETIKKEGNKLTAKVEETKKIVGDLSKTEVKNIVMSVVDAAGKIVAAQEEAVKKGDTAKPSLLTTYFLNPVSDFIGYVGGKGHLTNEDAAQITKELTELNKKLTQLEKKNVRVVHLDFEPGPIKQEQKDLKWLPGVYVPKETGKEEPIITEGAPVKVTVNPDIEYFLDLIKECKKNVDFFKGSTKSETQNTLKSSIYVKDMTSPRIHGEIYATIMKNWREGKYNSEDDKAQIAWALNQYLDRNLQALNLMLISFRQAMTSVKVLERLGQKMSDVLSRGSYYLNFKDLTLTQILAQIVNIKRAIESLPTGYNKVTLDEKAVESINEEFNSIVSMALMGDLENTAKAGQTTKVIAQLKKNTLSETKALQEVLAQYNKLVGKPVPLNALSYILFLACYYYDVQLYELYKQLELLSRSLTWSEYFTKWISKEKLDYSNTPSVSQNITNFASSLQDFINTYKQNFDETIIKKFENRNLNLEDQLKLQKYNFDENVYNTKHTIGTTAEQVDKFHKKDYANTFAKALETYIELKGKKTDAPKSTSVTTAPPVKTTGKTAEEKYTAIKEALQKLDSDFSSKPFQEAEREFKNLRDQFYQVQTSTPDSYVYTDADRKLRDETGILVTDLGNKVIEAKVPKLTTGGATVAPLKTEFKKENVTKDLTAILDGLNELEKKADKLGLTPEQKKGFKQELDTLDARFNNILTSAKTMGYTLTPWQDVVSGQIAGQLVNRWAMSLGIGLKN